MWDILIYARLLDYLREDLEILIFLAKGRQPI